MVLLTRAASKLLQDSSYGVDTILSSNHDRDQPDTDSTLDNDDRLYIPSAMDSDHAYALSNQYIHMIIEHEHLNVFSNSMSLQHSNRESSIDINAPQDKTPSPIVSSEIICHISMYLDDLKTIQNLYHATKDFYDDVCIDQGAVVRSCLMNGGRAKKTVEQLYPMIKTRSIYPITAKRLLYLVTEKLCEICGNVTRYPKNNSVKHVRSPYGILCCWRCVAKRQKSKRMTKRGSSFEANPFAHHAVLDHEKVAVKKIGWRFLIPS
eukprot:scaffold58968_cov40-Cyclotella_meneghiniana.AAC.2